MPKPVLLMTVQGAHKKYNSLTDQIWAKYEQLNSGRYESVDTKAFKAEACESTCLYQTTLPGTEPADSKGIIQAHILQALKTLFRSNLYTR